MGALINEREIKQLIKKYDAERTGKIAFDEYLLMMSEVVDKQDSVEMVGKAFSCFDKSQSSLLDIDEMKHVLSRVGDVLSPEEVNNFFVMLDKYGDRNARLEDLVALLGPQTNKDLYSKQVKVNNITDRSKMQYDRLRKF